MIGANQREDFENSYLKDVNSQVESACNLINADPKMAKGYHAVGFSQGGQFLRAVAQRCPSPPMLNLITFGAQHQGVYGLPRCPDNNTLCNLTRQLLNLGAYTDFVQKHLVQAQYWHDPLNEQLYRQKSLFLADINNERERNQTYKDNLLKLRSFVMVQFNDDTIVDPKISESFGYYAPGQSHNLIAMNETQLYQEDWIGLKQLDESGRLHVIEVPGNHLQINMDWFKGEFINRWLKN